MAITTLSQILLLPLILASALILFTNAHSEIITSPINIAIQDMQKARYFTFVMLMKMVSTKIPPNTTFLMPNDRTLSAAVITENQVLDFVLMHAIPSPMQYKDLVNLPNGTILPSSSHSNYLFRTVRRDDGKFYINNAELVARDICKGESLFRCHGISTVYRRSSVHKKAPIGTTCHAPPMKSPPMKAPAPVALAPAPMPTKPPTGTGTVSPALSPEGTTTDGFQTSASSDARLRRFFACFLGSSLLMVFGTVI